MSCVNVPHVGLGDIGLSLPPISLGLPSVTLGLCCKFSTPTLVNMATVNLAIANVFALVPGLSTVLQPVMAIIAAYIDIVNGLLDQITFSCPLNSS